MSKIYEGARLDLAESIKAFDESSRVTVTDDRGGPAATRTYLLPPRLDLRNHSPTGFEWGYNGSGPAQLALALCSDMLPGDDALAQSVYMRVKDLLIVPLNEDRWSLTEAQLLAAILQARSEHISSILGYKSSAPAPAGYHVVYVMDGDTVTRCLFSADTAEQFRRWVAKKGKRAELSVFEKIPSRDPHELDRALAFTEDFAREVL